MWLGMPSGAFKSLMTILNWPRLKTEPWGTPLETLPPMDRASGIYHWQRGEWKRSQRLWAASLELPSCASLSKLLHFSEPPSPHLQNRHLSPRVACCLVHCGFSVNCGYPYLCPSPSGHFHSRQSHFPIIQPTFPHTLHETSSRVVVLKCGPWTSSSTWGLIRNADSQAPP